MLALSKPKATHSSRLVHSFRKRSGTYTHTCATIIIAYCGDLIKHVVYCGSHCAKKNQNSWFYTRQTELWIIQICSSGGGKEHNGPPQMFFVIFSEQSKEHRWIWFVCGCKDKILGHVWLLCAVKYRSHKTPFINKKCQIMLAACGPPHAVRFRKWHLKSNTMEQGDTGNRTPGRKQTRCAEFKTITENFSQPTTLHVI